jgi:hypothetical protein
MFGGEKNPGLPARSDGDSDEVAGYETGKEKAYVQSIHDERDTRTESQTEREREREEKLRCFWNKAKINK